MDTAPVSLATAAEIEEAEARSWADLYAGTGGFRPRGWFDDAEGRRHSRAQLGRDRAPLLQPCYRPRGRRTGHRGAARPDPGRLARGRDHHVPAPVAPSLPACDVRGLAARPRA